MTTIGMVILTMLLSVAPRDTIYSAWTDTGIHLMMSDNGTPTDFDDDWVVDWETNRDFEVNVYDW